MIVSRVPSNQQFPNSRFNIAVLTVPEAHVYMNMSLAALKQCK